MIKAVIFDIDNTLYSYDENHIYGMEALAVYCRDSFGITTDEMQACYRKAGRIMTDRIGTDTAAIHSRMLQSTAVCCGCSVCWNSSNSHFFRMREICIMPTGTHLFSIYSQIRESWNL